MTKLEHVAALRADTATHYNCAQSVLIPFSGEAGVTRDQAFALAAHFGAGMGRGSVCGAATGGLMALGLLGTDSAVRSEFLRRFQEEAGAMDCAQLLQNAKANGESRKPHCDRMVYIAARLVEELTQGR